MDVERTNLLTFARLAIRDVIRSSSYKNDVVVGEDCSLSEYSTPDSYALVSCQRMLTVLEHCFCHGLRRDAFDLSPEINPSDIWRHSASFFWRAKEQVLSTANSLVASTVCPNPWPVLLFAEKCFPESTPPSESMGDISEVRTGLGRCRVWIRQALMQKRLGVYVQQLVDRLREDMCSPPFNTLRSVGGNNATVDKDAPIPAVISPYHPEALLLNDEGLVLAGLLVGLSSIDFCFILKDNLKELDGALQPVPYNVYMPNTFGPTEPPVPTDNFSTKIDLCSVVDQKAFLEDINAKLQKRYEEAQQAHRDQEETARALSEKVNELSLENRGLRIVLSHLKTELQDGIIGRYTPAMEETNGVVANRDSPPDPDNDDELHRLRVKIKEQALLLQSYREKLSASESRVAQLDRQLTSTRTLLEQKQLLIRQLQSKSHGLTTIMDQMRERLKTLSAEKISMSRALDQLKLQLSGLQTRYAQQDADLLTQRELIARLEMQLTERAADLEQLQPRVAELDACKQRMHHLEDEVNHWRTLSQEQETSLSEMAAVVSSSKLEADSLRESHNALKDAQWADDSVVPNCLQCNAAFSMSRRRHHCRNCGLIFCHNCSSNAMSLPSSAKPVRVCDKCHSLLLLRYSAKS